MTARTIRRCLAAVCVTSMAILAVASTLPAHSAFPGENGRLAFWSSDGVYTIEPDGSGLTHLLAGGTWPRWSPDGQRLVSQLGTLPGGEEQEFAVIEVDDGSHQTFTVPCCLHQMSWAPDGQRLIAFQANELDTHLVIIDLDAHAAITDVPGTEYMEGPTWSPLGDWIAAIHHTGVDDDSLQEQIVLVRPDGSDQRVLVGPYPIAAGIQRLYSWAGMDWAPDGSALVYYDHWTLRIVMLDGSGDRALTEPASGSGDIYPAWSPAGDRIGFVRSTLFEGLTFHTIAVDGTDEQLAFSAESIFSEPHQQLAEPDWQAIGGLVPPPLPPPSSTTSTSITSSTTSTTTTSTTTTTTSPFTTTPTTTTAAPAPIPARAPTADAQVAAPVAAPLPGPAQVTSGPSTPTRVLGTSVVRAGGRVPVTASGFAPGSTTQVVLVLDPSATTTAPVPATTPTTSTSTTSTTSTTTIARSTTTTQPAGPAPRVVSGLTSATATPARVDREHHLAEVTAGPDGTVATDVAIPATTPPGTHRVEVRGTAPDGSPRVVAEALRVTGGSEPTRPTGTIAATGTDTGPALTAGLAALALGLILYDLGTTRALLARRRHARQQFRQHPPPPARSP